MLAIACIRWPRSLLQRCSTSNCSPTRPRTAAAVVWVGTHELWQPGVQLHLLVGEPLPDQARRGDYGAGRGVLDYGEVRGVAGGMIPRHQVAREGGYPLWGSRCSNAPSEE